MSHVRSFTLSWTSAVMVVLALVAAALLLYKAHADASDISTSQSPRLLPITTVHPEAVEDFSLTTRYTGMIQSRRAATLAFQPEGRVTELNVEEGDAVSEGQPLAALDRRRLEASLRELEGELDSAEASLSLARQEERRQKSLREDDVASEQAVDQAIAERQRLEGQTKRLEGQRDRLQADLDDAVLRAPFDGVIVGKNIELGDMVSPGTAAFRLIQPQRLEARVGLPARERARYQKGDSVTLNVGGEEVTGTVLERLPEIDASRRTLTLRIALDNEDDQFFAGQLAHLLHDTRVDESGYRIPESALTGGRAGLWSVLVAEPEDEHYRIRRVSVEWLYGDGTDVLVRGPLSEDLRIVREGPHRLVPGQKVRLSDESGDEQGDAE